MDLYNLLFAKKRGGGSGGGSGGVITVTNDSRPSISAENILEDMEGVSMSVSYANATFIEYGAFRDCVCLGSIDAPKVDELLEYAFQGCTSLTSANLPAVTKIGTSAFSRCTSLASVNLQSANTMGEGVFANCASLTNVSLPCMKTINERAFEGCAKLTTVDLPVATEIRYNVFLNCTNLASLILRTTETVCVIDLFAFDNCPFLLNPETGTNNGHLYVPSVMYEYYRAGYEATLNGAVGEGAFDRIVRKIEDYPEICG